MSLQPIPSPPAREDVLFQGVTDYLAWDHARLDGLLEDVARGVREGGGPQVRQAFAFFAGQVDRHIRLEEEWVFPLFEVKAGMTGGPTLVLREEHREIRKAVQQMGDGLDSATPERFEEGRRFLESTLAAHDAREEHVLFPTLDRLLSPAERATFTRRLQER